MLRLQQQLRLHGEAIANSIVLEQGKTYPGALDQARSPPVPSLIPALDAQGDLLRGLQVVESATGIPSTLLGNAIEGMLTCVRLSIRILITAHSEQGHGYHNTQDSSWCLCKV